MPPFSLKRFKIGGVAPNLGRRKDKGAKRNGFCSSFFGLGSGPKISIESYRVVNQVTIANPSSIIICFCEVPLLALRSCLGAESSNYQCVTAAGHSFQFQLCQELNIQRKRRK